VELVAVVEKMMAKEPARRYQTPAEVAAALDSVSTVAGAVPPPTRRPRRRRGWPVVAVGIAAAAVAAVLLGAFVFRIATDKGEITLQTDDPDIEVVIKRGGELVRIIDLKSKQTWELDTAKMQIGLADQPEGLKIELPGKEPFTLRRGDRGRLTITRQPKDKGEQPAARVTRVQSLIWGADPTDTVCGVALSPDGRLVVVSRWGRSRIYDVQSGKHVADIPAAMTAFTPDGKQVVGTSAQTIRVFDAATGNKLREFGSVPKEVGIGGFALSPDGNTAWTSSTHDFRVRLWDVRRGEQLKQWSFQSGHGRFYWTADGKHFVMDVGEKTPWVVWDIASRKESEAFAFLGDHRGSLSFTSDGREVIASRDTPAGPSHTFFDISSGKKKREVVLDPTKDLGPEIWGSTTPDGRLIISGYRDGVTVLWDIHTGKRLDRCECPVGDVRYVSSSTDGRRFAVAGLTGTVVVWELPDPPAPEKP
jgi:WD40 repeat protein